MRLIDADALPVHRVKILHAFGVFDGDVIFPEHVANAITINSNTVRHGRWVYGEDVDIQCSECGKDAMSDWMKCTQVYSPYCPWCGAKMDLK